MVPIPLAVAATNEKTRKILVGEIGISKDSRFLRLGRRKLDEKELDEPIQTWTQAKITDYVELVLRNFGARVARA